MGLNTKQIGTVTEYQCATFFLERGYIVSFPLGEFAPYDFILDFNNYLYKIQVKHSLPIKDNAGFEFSCSRTHVNRSRNLCVTYSVEEIDYFCTIFDGIVYLVPSSECNSSKQLRTTFTRNYNKVPWAVDYEADYILEKLVNPDAKPRINMDLELQKLKMEIHEKYLDKNNSQYGTIWITDGVSNKKIKRSDQIPDGFKRGRTINYTKNR